MDDMLGSDDEDKHDAYLERMKREGQEVDSDDDDDEDSSEGIYSWSLYQSSNVCHRKLGCES